MRAVALALALLVAGCSSKPTPVTKNFSRRRIVEQWLRTWCSGADIPLYQVRDFSAPQDWGMVAGYRCLVRDGLGLAPMPITMTGWRTVPIHGGNDICRIQIGPARVTGEVSFEWVRELFLDPDLGERVAAAIGPSATVGRWIRTQISGVYVHVDLDPYGRSLLLILDGCGHLPLPSDEEQDRRGASLFPDAGVDDGGVR